MSKFLLNARIDNSRNIGNPNILINGKQVATYSYTTNFPFTDSGIVFNYSFTNSLTTDSSGNSYTLTNNGTVTQSDVTDSTNGITLYNTATFAGSSYFSRNTSSDGVLRTALDAATTPLITGYSFSFWIYNTNGGSAGECICLTSSTGSVTVGTDQVLTIFYNSGSINLSINGSSTAAYLVASYAISQSQWYHISITISLTTVNLYINGQPASFTYTTGSATTGITQSLLTNINRLYIGNRFNTRYLLGSLKNVIFSSTIWTSDQVKQIYYTQLRDVSSFNNSFTGFNADTNTGILRQKNSTYSLISSGQSFLDVSSSGTTFRNIVSNSLSNSGTVIGGVYISDTNLIEPPTLTTNVQTVTNNAGLTYTYEATANSSLSAATGPYNVFSNNNSNYYADEGTQTYNGSGVAIANSVGASTVVDGSTVLGTWLQIDMGRRVSVVSFSMLPRTGFVSRAPNVFYMCGSNDNSTWSSIYTNVSNSVTWVNSVSVSFTPAKNSYRYFRLVVNTLGNPGNAGTTFNLTRLAFVLSANLSIDGSLTVGSNISNIISSFTSPSNGLVLNIPTLTYTDNSANGTQATQYLTAIRQPTYSALNTRTITRAASLYVEGAPILGTNETITNDYSLYIDAANSTSATLTEAASLYIANAPTVTSGSTYAIKVAAGKVYFGGALQFTNGATNNYVLTSDASGNATWQAAQTAAFGDGSSTNPSISFTNEAGTGFYRLGTGQLGMSLSGTNYATYTTTGNTFTRPLTISATTNQLVFGITNTTTITSTAPVASRTYTIPDAGGAASFVMTASGSTQTISGGLTSSGTLTASNGLTLTTGALNLTSTSGTVSLSGTSFSTNNGITISASSNQIVLSSGNTVTITTASQGGTRAYTIPDAGGAASFILSASGSGQTISGALTFSGTTAATSSTAANIINSGGEAIAKNIWIGSSFANTVNGTNGAILAIPTLTFTDNSTAASGTSGNTVIMSIAQPTISATNTGVVTTKAITAYIGGAPIQGTNQSFTNTYGLYIDSAAVTNLSGTEAASLYINGAPNITAGTAYAIKVTSGVVRIGGTLQIPTGATNNYVLTSDASGNASWQATQTATFADGSSTNPSISFTNEAGTGFYRLGTGQLGMSLSGTNYATYTTNGNTFTRSITITPTTNQLVLGVTNTTTISATAPSASRIYTLPDAGGAASFILSTSGSGQTIAGGLTSSGTSTFSGQIIVNKAGGTSISTASFYSNPASTALSGNNTYYFNTFAIPTTTGSTSANTYNVYIDGAASGGGTNVAFYVNSGLSQFNGTLRLNGSGNTASGNSTFWIWPLATALTGSNTYYYTYFVTPQTSGSTTGSGYTIYIEGAPPNTTNAYSLYVAAGNTSLLGGLTLTGATSISSITGSSAIDFSGSSGIFKTPTGASTIGGPFYRTVQSLSGTTTLSATTGGSFVVITSGTFTVTLPVIYNVTANNGLEYSIVNNGTGVITIAVNNTSNESFDGNTSITTLVLNQNDRMRIMAYSSGSTGYWYTW